MIYVRNKNPRYIEPLWYRYLKIWLIVIVVLVIIFSLFYFLTCGSYDNYDMVVYDSTNQNIDFFNSNRREYLKSITPAHPPPLVNFMDGPNLMSQRYRTLSDL